MYRRAAKERSELTETAAAHIIDHRQPTCFSGRGLMVMKLIIPLCEKGDNSRKSEKAAQKGPEG